MLDDFRGAYARMEITLRFLNDPTGASGVSGASGASGASRGEVGADLQLFGLFGATSSRISFDSVHIQFSLLLSSLRADSHPQLDWLSSLSSFYKSKGN